MRPYFDRIPAFAQNEIRKNFFRSRREMEHRFALDQFLCAPFDKICELSDFAERAIAGVYPGPSRTRPLVTRAVCELLASDGSEAAAATCGATLALIDADVHVANPVGAATCGFFPSRSTESPLLLTDLSGVEVRGCVCLSMIYKDELLMFLSCRCSTRRLSVR